MLICKKKTHAPTPIIFLSMVWTDPICERHVMQEWVSCGKGSDMGGDLKNGEVLR